MKRVVVIEWPKGSRVRWEWDGERFHRRETEAPAPVNYGFLPGTKNPADQSEVDAVLLGLPVPAGKRVEAELVAALWLADGDHKFVFVPQGGKSDKEELAALLAWFPEERQPRILEGSEARALLLAML